MNFEKLKNELELDEKLNVVAFESGVGDLLLYDNIMIINYGGNGYRLIFDENHILIQLLTSAYMYDNGIDFDAIGSAVGKSIFGGNAGAAIGGAIGGGAGAAIEQNRR